MNSIVMDMDTSQQPKNSCVIDKPRQLTLPNEKCPFHKCDGSGIVLTEYGPNGYFKDYPYVHTVAHRCLCSGKSNSEYRQSRSLIPPEYLNKHLSDIDWNIYQCSVSSIQTVINDFITDFTEYERKPYGIFLYSKTKGSGKTLIASASAQELIDRYSLSVKFITVLDFLSLVKKNYKADEYSDDISALFKARLLILDDIGFEKPTEHTDTMLFQLINERANNHLVTIYTSNLTIDALKLDERTIDRINKTVIVLNIPEVPVRRIKADTDKKTFLRRNIKQ